jgi:hypothetical protein
MTDTRVEVRGLRELAAGSRRLADLIEQATRIRFRRAADGVAARTRGRVPRVTGRLAGSVESGDGPRADVYATVGLGGGVPYARWIEFGGGRGRPYVTTGRYLYPTAKEAEPAFTAAAENAATTQIRTMKWPAPKP